MVIDAACKLPFSTGGLASSDPQQLGAVTSLAQARANREKVARTLRARTLLRDPRAIEKIGIFDIPVIPD